MNLRNKRLAILGTRGIPAQHGGFETFAEELSCYLQQRGWLVTVYCQEKSSSDILVDYWAGVRRVRIPISQQGAKGTVLFDWKSTSHAIADNCPLVLVLGYNTAIFSICYRLKGIATILNMDGIEWQRSKWNIFERCWLYLNEKIGIMIANHLVADHPEIKKHLLQLSVSDRISMIPYCANIVESCDHALLRPFGLIENEYCLLIARPEQENSILEIIRAYSAKERGMPLVILGDYMPNSNKYHKKVCDAAGAEIQFMGSVYEKNIVETLRACTRLYIHGHTVGGTNPSLVEALAAGSPILAHDNIFNRWVAGRAAYYFLSEKDCSEKITELLGSNLYVFDSKKKYGRKRVLEKFNKERVLFSYEELFKKYLPDP